MWSPVDSLIKSSSLGEEGFPGLQTMLAASCFPVVICGDNKDFGLLRPLLLFLVILHVIAVLSPSGPGLQEDLLIFNTQGRL